MGGMHTWLWGETHPDFMDALMPLASLPAPIAGRNRMWRKMAMDAIRDDPDWKGGDYAAQPRGLKGALSLLLVLSRQPAAVDAAGARPRGRRRRRRTLADGTPREDRRERPPVRARRLARLRPVAAAGRIQAPLLALNFADDAINPPELGILEKGVARVKNGQAVVFPLSEKTRGHQTHTWADCGRPTSPSLLVRSKK